MRGLAQRVQHATTSWLPRLENPDGASAGAPRDPPARGLRNRPSSHNGRSKVGVRTMMERTLTQNEGSGRGRLKSELTASPEPEIIALHPTIAERYRGMVASLERTLQGSDSEAGAQARDLVRQLIETVVVTPLPERGKI